MGGGGGTVSTKVAFFVVSGPNCSRLAKGAATTTQVVGSADSPEYVCLCQQPHKEAHGISSVCTNSACSHSRITRFTFLSFFYLFFLSFFLGGGGEGGPLLILLLFSWWITAAGLSTWSTDFLDLFYLFIFIYFCVCVFFVKVLVAVARRPFVKMSTTDQLHRDN